VQSVGEQPDYADYVTYIQGDFTAAAAGTYTLLVADNLGNDSGQFILQVQGSTNRPITPPTDNQNVGITVTPTSGLVTTEAGGTASFSVVLNSQPTANVTIALSSNDTTEGTVSTSSLVFTPSNWNIAQSVTVTGVDDALVDGTISYSIITAAASSTDSNYNGLNAADVSVINTDNDSAGITVNPTSGLTTTEAGGTASFSVVLNSQPTANVTIALSSNDTTEGTVSTSSLVFTPSNWNIAQSVTVNGVDDALVDGNIGYSIITAAATSTDSNYNGLNAADVSVINTDNDSAGITVTPTSGLVTTEAGGTASFSVVLNSQPSAAVTIALSSNDTTEGTVSTSSLVFSPSNWNIAQSVTVTGVDDALVDGNISYSIITAAATSTDSNYNGLSAADVSVINSDNDSAGITVNPTSGLVTTEAGGTASFSVVLNSQPTANVTIALSSNDTTEGTVSTSSLVFTPSNWNVAQSVTVTGVDDALVDGNIGYSIITAAATSTDSNYNGLNAADVSVINTDNDSAGITVNGTTAKDILTGTDGPDIITGFQGPDILTGKGGADRFVYLKIVDGGDTITDFNPAEGDTVDLSGALKNIGYNGLDPIADGYLKFLQIGSNAILQIDPDGSSGRAAARNFIQFNGLNVATLNSATNFLF
jgi:uncharacterized protein YfdQ (DUF2303 family)